MSNTRILSPSRSQGAGSPRRHIKPRLSRSVSSQSKSNKPSRLSAVLSDSFVISPLPNKSILNDDTYIEAPKRTSWWKKLDDGTESSNVIAMFETKTNYKTNNVEEEYMNVEIISQENKCFTLDLPESSDGESINSIVIPQRKLFTQKDGPPQEKYNDIVNNRETLPKIQKSYIFHDKELNVGPKNLFNKKPRNNLIFPAALINISANKTVDKTKEDPIVEAHHQIRSLFGNRPATRRKNIFAAFVVSESEDEIPEIQGKIFGFKKNNNQKRRISSASNKQHSPTSSITDIDIDDWKHLPSSTLVGNQLEEGNTTPSKRVRLSKLIEIKESDEIESNSNNKNKSNISKNKSEALSNSKAIEIDVLGNVTAQNTKNKSQIDKSKTIRKDLPIEDNIEITNVKTNTGEATIENVLHENEAMTKATEDQIPDSSIHEEVDINDEDFTLEYESDEEIFDNYDKKGQKSTVTPNSDKTMITNEESQKETSHKANKSQNISDLIKSNEIMVIKKINIIKNMSINKMMTSNNETERKNDITQTEGQKVHNDREDINESSKSVRIILSDENGEKENIHLQKTKDYVIRNTPEKMSGSVNVSLKDKTKDTGDKNINVSEVRHEEEDENENENKAILEETVQSESEDISEKIADVTAIDSEDEKEENKSGADEYSEQEQNNESDQDGGEETDKDDSIEQDENDELDQMKEGNEVEDVCKFDRDIEDVELNEVSTKTIGQNDGELEEDIIEEEINEIQNKSGLDEINLKSISLNVNNNDQNENESHDTIERQEEQEEIENNGHNESGSDEIIDKQNGQDEVENSDQNGSESDETDESEQEKHELEQNHISKAFDTHNDENTEESDSDAQENSTNEGPEFDNNTVNSNFHDSNDDRENTSEIETADQTGNITKGANKSLEKDPTLKSPEAILNNRSYQIESSRLIVRDSNVRKSKSIIKNLNRHSLATMNESAGFSNGANNSSAEGSGWDSHRTTRKTLRQTFGRDFTPRKSLRTLVMEKTAKRQTDFNEGFSVHPPANSTELPDNDTFDENEPMHIDETPEKSKHDVSRHTGKLTQEVIQKIISQNNERKRRMDEKVRDSLLTQVRGPISIFKVPLRPANRAIKAKPKQTKPAIIPDMPADMFEELQYKPPKRFRPSNASWVTKRLYKFLENKLEPKYDYKARIRAEKLVQAIYDFTKCIRRHNVAPADAVDLLKHEMARLIIVKTHFEFYNFFVEYMPREVRIKVVPDVVNNLPLPRNGIFADIL